MDNDKLRLIEEILEEDELEFIPLHLVKEVAFYDKNQGWVRTSIEDFIEICSDDELYEEMDISRINYYLDYETLIKRIYDTTENILKGTEEIGDLE